MPRTNRPGGMQHNLNGKQQKYNIEEIQGLLRHLYWSYRVIRPAGHHSPDQELDDIVQKLGAKSRF